MNFTFTVTAQSGRPEHSDAVTLEFVVLPSDVDSWLAWVWAPGAEPRLLSDANATAHGLFRLPESAAGQSAHIGFALPYGARIAPADQAPAVPLGATGTNTTYAFTVTAQSGQGADDHALTFAVAPSSDRSWTATLTAPGFRQELTPDSAGALTLPEAAAHGEATLTLTLPYGATVAPDALSVPLALPATGAAAPAYAFTVTSQSGAAAAEFVLALRVAPSSNFNWTALVTAPGRTLSR